MSRVPRIRFKGFEEDWEQRKLGEIADKVVEKNFQLQERDVFTNSAEFGIIDQKDFFDHEIVNKNNIGGYYIVSPNDFDYNPRISVTAPVGPINRNKLCKRGIMSPLYTVFHPRNMNETFLEFYFKTNKWHKFMEYNGDSGARSDRFSIKTELFYAMTIPFPSREEQSKVGICFESIDHLITLHQRKLEKLKIIKKSMLENLFPQNEEKTPKIRFSGFTKDWEQRKLGEIYTQLVERNIELLPFKKILSVSTMTYKGDGNGAAEESLSSYKRLRVGDIAFEGHTSKDFRYGRFVLNDTGDGIMSPRFSALRPISDMPIKFWKYYIHYEPIMKKILVNSTKSGTMMNELVVEEFLKEILLVPKKHEQQKIGRFFYGIDHLITLHQSKLEKLQKIKKSMLESMFV
nr:restriction endonuclease subunit S [uncultured Lachnoanaerobaculum sp.]